VSDGTERIRTALAARYDIERELGRGGMATVYLARDVRHDRWVAVKVLHPELSAVLGPGRFLNEIRVTANLQHPHVLPLHDSGEADGLLYYVMPFVEGESLRDLLDRETQLPIDDVVHYTTEIADGLGYANSLGVIHRDIKPENVLLSGGHALIADFGIARAVSDVAGTRLTETGLSVGTPQYMSPEQASGADDLDARSDVYSLGCVVYEMLVGEPPHTGPTAQAVVAKVLTQPVPSVRDSRETVAPAMERAVAKALAKLPADRFATATQFGDALRASLTVAAPESSTRRASPWRRRPAWAIGAAALVTAGALAFWSPWRTAPTGLRNGQVRRLSLTIEPLAVTGFAHSNAIAISPDGARVAYVSGAGGTGQIILRDLDAPAGTSLAGIDNAQGPFFSPDGESLGFVQNDTLMTIDLATRQVTIVCPAPIMHGAVWSVDGTIVFGGAQNIGWGLARVPARGGEPEIVLPPDSSSPERYLIYPSLLPEANAVLFTSLMVNGLSDGVDVLFLDTGERRTLLERGSAARYVPSGHLVYANDGALYAAPFDARNVRITGAAREVIPDVLMGLPQEYENPHYAVSDDGTLVYLARGDFVGERLVWVDRAGGVEAVPELVEQADQAGVAGYYGPRLSPDGSRVLFWAPGGRDELASEVTATVWVWDFARGRLTRPAPAQNDLFWSIWTPDGSRILSIGASVSTASGAIYAIVPGSSAEAELVTPLERGYWPQPYSVSADGTHLFYIRSRGGVNLDIWTAPLDDPDAARPVLNGPANETHPAISPDGRLLAYASDESGQYEVYIRDFPSGSQSKQVSTAGGQTPAWSPDGRELFFMRQVEGDMALMVVTRDATEGTRTEPPRELFRGPFNDPMTFGRPFDVSRDGRRFLMIHRSEGGTALAQLSVVLNWFGELREQVGD